MDGAIEAFIRSVNVKDSRIFNTPNLVFLCGGPTEKAGPELSARDHFYRYLGATEPELSKRVKLAETINSWFDHDTFPDLLELEEYLADLSDVVVIFVESPGSIAELGAFAASTALRPKTLAVLNEAHPASHTFISDGPVRRIQNADRSLVRYYDWNSRDVADPANALPFYDMDRDLRDLLVERQQAVAKGPTIDLSSHGHVMLLIADLIEMIGITFSTEVIECLARWGHSVDHKQLEKYLSLLEHLRLIKRKRNSNQTYLIGRAPSGFVRYGSSASGQVFDRKRTKSLMRASLARSDERRMRIFTQYLSELAKRVPAHV